MSYSTPADVRAALVPGGGTAVAPAGTAASLTDLQLQDSIIEADAKIDSYLAARYVTPVAGDPVPVIKAMSRDIAAYLATLTWRKNKDFPDIDPVARRYNDAIGFLRAVTAGQATLPIPTNTGDGATGEAGTALNAYRGNLFTGDDLDLRQPTFNWPVFSERW